MSLRLIHHVVITRGTVFVNDPFGNPKPSGTQLVYSGECRLIEDQERLTEGSVTRVTVYRLLLPTGADVQERDSIAQITFETGATLQGGFQVQSIATKRFLVREHHKTAVLERIV